MLTSFRIKFAANATIDLPLSLACYEDKDTRGTTETCLLGDESIPASLSSPFVIYPQAPDYPYTPADDYRPLSCVGRSDDPQWQVDDLVFDHTAVASTARSTDATGYHALTFKLTNLQNYESQSCLVRVDQHGGLDDTLTEKWLDCNTPTGVAPPPGGILSTRIMFDAEYGLLGVNQSWTCPEARPDIDPYVAEPSMS